MQEKLTKTKNNVLKLLKANPELRGDYKKLTLMYWVYFDGMERNFTIDQLFNHTGRLTPPESITRASRYLVELFPELKKRDTRSIERDYKQVFKR